MSIQNLISIDPLLETFLKSIQLKTASIHYIDLSCDSMGFQGDLAMMQFFGCIRSQGIFQILIILLELQMPFGYYNTN